MFFAHRHLILFRSRVCSRALGSGACREPYRIPRRSVGPGPTAQVWAEVRRTCSGGSKPQVTRGRHSERVEPSRPMQTHNRLTKCPTAHVISRILNVVIVVRHYLVMERYFPDTSLRDMRPLFSTIRCNLHDLGKIVSSHARSCVEDMTPRWLDLHLRPSCTSKIMLKVNNTW